MDMTDTQTQLLREIGNGRSSFQRDERSDAGTARLRVVLDDLEAIESLGFIEIVERHHESWSAHKNLDIVRVHITVEGQDWLRNHPDQSQPL